MVWNENSITGRKLEKNPQNIEIKHHAAEKPMGHWGNQWINKNIPTEKWKQKYDILKSLDAAEVNPRRKIIAI